MSDAFLLRGYYRLNGKTGQTLEKALRALSPEIYGTMNDTRITELRGLEYVLDRLPRGMEECNRFVITAQEDLEGTTFEEIRPPKRRRVSYRVSENEMGFVVSRGLSEIYDILTHITFLYGEAKKIYSNVKDEEEDLTREWKALEKHVEKDGDLSDEERDKAIWNLSILLGRTYQETKDTYEYLEKSKKETASNNGLFRVVRGLARRIEEETNDGESLAVRFTPSLIHVILHQIYGKKWAAAIKEKLKSLGLLDRPLHIVSANMHSVLTLLYGYAATQGEETKDHQDDLYRFVHSIRQKGREIRELAGRSGFWQIEDSSGSEIDCQIVDTSLLESVEFHPAIKVDMELIRTERPVLLVMDYAFGTQAFEVMDELLRPWIEDGSRLKLNVRSISVMGKAGILPGKKGDIMLASAHVLEGTPHNYRVDNDLREEDFDSGVSVYVGPIITVLGTSLQNRDVLEKFQESSWNAVGLEMEGGHYQRAINAAVIRGHISKDVKLRYAYYASDNPLVSGQTLASGSMGSAGVAPAYMITKAILEKILN
ncbi:MAG: hypothetical protein JRI47_01670 [Deltaproteobacteria bacterium]|nr:hypothetical protein [Deltaproteobacteria bacterium]